jgi:hypothetical protein
MFAHFIRPKANNGHSTECVNHVKELVVKDVVPVKLSMQITGVVLIMLALFND